MRTREKIVQNIPSPSLRWASDIERQYVGESLTDLKTLLALHLEVGLDIRDQLAARAVHQPPAVCTGSGTAPSIADGRRVCGICGQPCLILETSLGGWVMALHPYKPEAK
jgi:hypothetical protein